MSEKCWKCGSPRTKPRKPPDYRRKYRNKNFIQHDPLWYAGKCRAELEAIHIWGGDEKTRNRALGEIGLRNMSLRELQEMSRKRVAKGSNTDA